MILQCGDCPVMTVDHDLRVDRRIGRQVIPTIAPW
jgi:hypothetical protein